MKNLGRSLKNFHLVIALIARAFIASRIEVSEGERGFIKSVAGELGDMSVSVFDKCYEVRNGYIAYLLNRLSCLLGGWSQTLFTRVGCSVGK